VAFELHPLTDADTGVAEGVLDEALGGRRQVRLGEVIDVLALPGVAAWMSGRLVGVATWAPGDPVELAGLAVAADCRHRGIGAALVEAVVAAAWRSAASSVWLVTTNDNLGALGLYQRLGFRIVRVVPGGADEARRLKPEIPLVGDHGIRVHDELVLECSRV